MAQFLRPDGDTALGSWSNPSFSVIDEIIRSDADETITGNNPSSDTLEVSTSNASSPGAGTRTFRYTYKKTGVKNLSITVELREGTTVVETNAHSNIGTTYVQNNHVVTGSITDYNNVNFRFIATVSGGGSPAQCQVSWAEFEIPDAAGNGALTLDLSDNADNLGDNLANRYSYRKILADNLDNLLDDLIKAYGLTFPFEDNLNNWLDQFESLYGLTRQDGDSLDNWLDLVVKRLEYRISQGETLSLSDTLVLRYVYRLILSDNLNNLADNLGIATALTLNFNDNLENWLDAFGFYYGLTKQSGDDLSNWLDTLTNQLSYKLVIGETLNLSDELNRLLDHILIFSESYNNLADSNLLRLGLLISFQDNINNWLDVGVIDLQIIQDPDILLTFSDNIGEKFRDSFGFVNCTDPSKLSLIIGESLRIS